MAGRRIGIALLLAAGMLAAGMLAACKLEPTGTMTPCENDPNCADEALADQPSDNTDGSDDALIDPAPINPVRPVERPAEQPAPEPSDTASSDDGAPADEAPVDNRFSDAVIDLDELYTTPGASSPATYYPYTPHYPLGMPYTGSTWDLLSLWIDGMTMGLLDPYGGGTAGGSSYTYLELMCRDSGTPDSICRSRYGN